MVSHLAESHNEKGYYSFVIPGRLPSLNEYISLNRCNAHIGAKMKKDFQKSTELYITSQLRNVRIKKPIYMKYHFYEKDMRRDKDNISSVARKIIQDALVTRGVINNDGWKEIIGYEDNFSIDRKNPRIVVEIIEFESEAEFKKMYHPCIDLRGW